MHVGYTKIAILDQYMASSRAVNGTTAKCYSHAAAQDRGKLVTFIAGKRRHFVDGGSGRQSVYQEDSTLREDNRTALNLKPP